MNGPPIGATLRPGGGAHFEVWAPRAARVDLEIVSPRAKRIRMQGGPRGYFSADVPRTKPGALYWYRLDGGPRRADPASRSQPRGLHGPSALVDASVPWGDTTWRGVRRRDLVLYELHTGTFTQEGTFEAIVPDLARLRRLGVTAVEVMPVAQFSGTRNWGYDGVFLFAPQHNYGGPVGLRRLVDAAHQEGLGVILDVVYNHVGPEGNHLPEFGPYFAGRSTPWGLGVNVDGPGADEVRHFLLTNALQWLLDYHMDGLRLDAVHEIHDRTARTFLEELGDVTRAAADERGFPFHLIAESSTNDPRYALPSARGGFGLDLIWNDDFSHSLYAFASLDPTAYHGDYPFVASLAKSYTDGFVVDGGYSNYRRRRHGRSSRMLAPDRLVVFGDNHDQVGNRASGERNASLLSFEAQKLCAAATLLSPNVPMLFMGEEYGETAPFLYFTDHRSKRLREAVRKGRLEEFRAHGWPSAPPDHAAAATFERSKLDHGLAAKGSHRQLQDFHHELLAIRAKDPTVRVLRRDAIQCEPLEDLHALLVTRVARGRRSLLILHAGRKHVSAMLPIGRGPWRLRLDSTDPRWGGTGGDAPTRLPTTKSAALVPLAPSCAYLYTAGDDRA